jgi:DNA-binding NarL/FixJ family response regulator
MATPTLSEVRYAAAFDEAVASGDGLGVSGPPVAPTPAAALEAFLEGRLRLVAVTRSESGLVLWVRRTQQGRRVATLPKERRVLSFLVGGASQKQIAYEIGVSAPAVSICVRNLLARLGLGQTLHLIMLVRAVHGISEPELVAMSRLSASRIGFEPAELALQVAPDPEAITRLSLAELDVTLAALEGHDNSTIAAQRRTCLRTVVNQLAAVFRKLQISGRLELASRLTLPGSCTPPSARLRRLAAAAARDRTDLTATGYDGRGRWIKPPHAVSPANGIFIAGY